MNEKTLLITGGSRGIGREICIKFAEKGYKNIIINYLENHSAAEETADMIEKIGSKAILIPANLIYLDEIDIIFDKIASMGLEIDVFVNSAVKAVFKPIIETKPNQYDLMMNANARPFWYCCKKVTEIMNPGCIIAISSRGANRIIPGYGILGPAKATLEALVKYIAFELAGKNIRVNGVCSGFVETQAVADLPQIDLIREFVESNAPLGKICSARDVANAVYMLTTADASAIIGQVINVDGGLSLI